MELEAYQLWSILGIFLIILEIFVPATLFLWMGISALLSGVVVYIMPELGINSQILFFSITSIVSILVIKKFFPPAKDENPTNLNTRASSIVNSVVSIHVDEKTSQTKAKVDDTLWIIDLSDEYKGINLSDGDKVKVVGTESNKLIVEPIVTK